jgi:hypothetical protein
MSTFRTGSHGKLLTLKVCRKKEKAALLEEKRKAEQAARAEYPPGAPDTPPDFPLFDAANAVDGGGKRRPRKAAKKAIKANASILLNEDGSAPSASDTDGDLPGREKKRQRKGGGGGRRREGGKGNDSEDDPDAALGEESDEEESDEFGDPTESSASDAGGNSSSGGGGMEVPKKKRKKGRQPFDASLRRTHARYPLFSQVIKDAAARAASMNQTPAHPTWAPTHAQWNVTAAEEAIRYLPTAPESVTAKLPNTKTEQTFNLFDAGAFNGKKGSAFYVGGPVRQTEWCPSVLDKSDDLIAVVAANGEAASAVSNLADTAPQDGAIQLWTIAKTANGAVPQLLCAIGIDFGFIRRIAWLPNGGAMEGDVPRAGVLAVAAGTFVRIYAVPDTATLSTMKMSADGMDTGGVHGARFQAQFYTCGCHWIPHMFA